MCVTDLVAEEFAVTHSEVGEARHAQKHVTQRLFVELSRADVELVDERVLPLHCSNVLVF